MKVLFSTALPFFLAHGGVQTVIESLLRELPAVGVEVEPERWWDAAQRGDVLHYFGRPPSNQHVELAHQKGLRVVMTEFLDQTASRSGGQLVLQKLATRLLAKALGPMANRFAWETYRTLDAMVYSVPHELETACYLFGAAPQRGYIIGYGLNDDVLAALREPATEGDYLVSTATIAPRKNSVLLARAARAAQVPVVFLGKPYSKDDPYFREFESLVDQNFVRYPGFVSEAEKHSLLRGARGFALLSRFESGCIAVYEAAAAGLPLFLSDLPWANRVYHTARQRTFAPLAGMEGIVARLNQFYAAARRSDEPTFSVPSWREVAHQYRHVYERVLGLPVAK